MCKGRRGKHGHRFGADIFKHAAARLKAISIEVPGVIWH